MVRLPVLLQKSFLRWGGGYDGSGTSFNLTRVMVFPVADLERWRLGAGADRHVGKDRQLMLRLAMAG